MGRKTAYLERDYARFYDWGYQGVVDDIPFYLAAAGKYGGPILELACGTGRLTLPLARAGFEIIGLDLSAEMLAIAVEKLGRETEEVQPRVRLRQGDMADFRLDEPVRLALIPQASFFHLHTRKQQQDCLACAHRALAPEGALIVDLIPARMMANQETGATRVFGQGISPTTGGMVRELGQLSIDQTTQCVTVEHTYVEEQADGSERRFDFVDDYTWVTEAQMRDLLQAAGFGRIEVFGGYDQQPFTDTSQRMIFVAGE